MGGINGTALHVIGSLRPRSSQSQIVSMLLDTLNHPDPRCRIDLYARNGENKTALDVAREFEQRIGLTGGVSETLSLYYDLEE